jgi:hypothetical protein
MSCYFRHMKDIFEGLGIEVTKENKKRLDAALHKIAGVGYKDCPGAWRALKEKIKDPVSRKSIIASLKKEAGRP